MNYISLNDDYVLKPDEGQALILTSLLGRNLHPEIGDSFTNVIHPIYAMILSFVDGRQYDFCIRDASEYLDIPAALVKGFIDKLINNPDSVYLKSKDGVSQFPPHTIISHPEEKKTTRYNPNIFHYTDADVKIKRHKTPSELTLMVNNICVTDCIYCYEDKSKKVSCGIPLDRIIDLIREAKRLHVNTFDVIGGEFFLYPHWREVMTELRKNGYHPYLSTKKPLSEDEVRFLADLNIHDLQVSIDSLIEAHLVPSLNVKSGYVNSIRNTLALLRKYGIPLKVHTVLTKYTCNVEDIDSIFLELKDKDNLIDWHIVKADPSLYPRRPYDSFIFSAENLNVVIDHLEILKNTSGLSIRYPEKVRENEPVSDVLNTSLIKNEKLFFNRSFCSGLYSSLYILPDGKVTICEQLYWNKNFIVGDVLENSIEEIWNSDKSTSLYYITRNDIPSDSICHSCDKFEVCRNLRQVCYREIIRKYGADKWYYPDPSCPYNN